MIRLAIAAMVAALVVPGCGGRSGDVDAYRELTPRSAPVLFVNGQSNATGLDMPEASLYSSPSILSRDASGWVPARAELAGYRPAGIGAWAGRVMRTRISESGGIGYVDNLGWPSAPIAYFLPDSPDAGGLHGEPDPDRRNNYRIARDTWTESGVEPTVIAWSQGEADIGTSEEDYASALAALTAAWIRDYPALERIVVIRTAEKACGVDTSAVRAAQKAVVEREDFPIDLVDVDDLTGDPSVHTGCHYTLAGYDRIADRVLDHLD